MDEQLGGDAAGQAEHRADRQVDARGEDDQQLADGDDPEDRHLAGEVGHVVGGEELVGAQRHGAEQDEQDDQAAGVAAEDVAEREDALLGASVRRARRRRGGGRRMDWLPCLVSSYSWAAAPGLASRRTSSSVVPRAGQLARDAALAHDEHAVGEAEHLGQVGGHDDHAEPFGGEVADHLVDLRLGADVDALGGLVEEQDLGLRGQPAGEQHLLLVAARQRRHRLLPRPGAQLEPAEVVVDEVALRFLSTTQKREISSRCASEAFSRIDSSSSSPSVLAVLGQQPEPGLHRACAGCRRRPARRRPRCGRPRPGRRRRSRAAARSGRSRAAPRCRGSRRRAPRSRSAPPRPPA